MSGAKHCPENPENKNVNKIENNFNPTLNITPSMVEFILLIIILNENGEVVSTKLASAKDLQDIKDLNIGQDQN